jgi:1-acyl-sn-glycerol-3-phosphate acyltransferase
MMGTLLFLFIFLIAMLWWELVLRVIYIFNAHGARVHADIKVPQYSRRLFGIARTYTGISIQRRLDLPPGLPDYFMVISNHQSFIDIPFIFSHIPQFRPRFIAKEELARGVPLVSFLFRVQKHPLIRRAGGSSQSMKELERMARWAGKGYCPVVFPEGTRSKDGRLLPFHRGAARKILETVPMPVLCIALDGGYRVSGLMNLLRNMRGTNYRIEAVKLFPAPRGKEDVKDIIERSRELIEEQLKRWRNGEQRRQ